MKLTKKLISIVLAVTMLLAVFPLTVGAADKIPYAVTGGNLYFDPATGTITDCDAGVSAANIPAEINGIAVTAIGRLAFYECISLTEITLPQGINTIGYSAFLECDGLTEIVIPDSVTTIDSFAFQGCDRLTEITIPANVTKINHGAFSDCGNLETISVHPDNTSYATVDGVLFDKALQTLVACPAGIEGSYAVPTGVTTIFASAFLGCDLLTTIIIPQGVTKIGNEAFYDCDALQAISIPASLVTIGGWVCSECDVLTDIYFSGDEKQWVEEILPQNYNDVLLSAKLHYNNVLPRIPLNGTAYPSTQTITLDGEKVVLPAYALKDENGNLTNYVKLRDIAYLLNGTSAQFSVNWMYGVIDIHTDSVYHSGGEELKTPFDNIRPYEANKSATKVDGVVADIDAITLTNDNGGAYTYYKLRDLGTVCGFGVDFVSGVGIVLNTDTAR